MIARTILYYPSWKPGTSDVLPPSWYWFQVGSGSVKWIQEELILLQTKQVIIWED